MVIYCATSNTGKFNEYKRFLTTHAPFIELLQFDRDIPELQTLDQKAIALSKAEYAWNLLHKPVLIDDVGFYFDHYNNFPGTLSRFIFQGIGFEGLLKLAEADNNATKKLYLVFKDQEHGAHVFEGICRGKIMRPAAFEPTPHLPYDTIFYPDGYNETLAHLRKTKRDETINVRIQAIKQFLAWFQKT